MSTSDLTLMYVTDDRIKDNVVFYETLEASLKGGVTIVQLREKESDLAFFKERAIKAKTICQEFNVPLIINDHVELAVAIGADGAHIGQSDMSVEMARQLLGADKILGLSVSNVSQAKAANALDVDYIGASPIFSTATKTKDLDMPLGIDGLRAIKLESRKPIICIGGVDQSNAALLMEIGASGIAVVSAISQADNPEKESKNLKSLVCPPGTIA